MAFALLSIYSAETGLVKGIIIKKSRIYNQGYCILLYITYRKLV